MRLVVSWAPVRQHYQQTELFRIPQWMSTRQLAHAPLGVADGDLIAVGIIYLDPWVNSVRILRTNPLREVAVVDVGYGDQVFRSLAFAPSGHHLAVFQGDSVRLRKSGHFDNELGALWKVVVEFLRGGAYMAFDPSGVTLSVAYGSHVLILGVESGDKVHQFETTGAIFWHGIAWCHGIAWPREVIEATTSSTATTAIMVHANASVVIEDIAHLEPAAVRDEETAALDAPQGRGVQASS